jgi:hypothetical protein
LRGSESEDRSMLLCSLKGIEVQGNRLKDGVHVFGVGHHIPTSWYYCQQKN